MDAFEYLSVLISIIIGIGLAHLLDGVAKLIRYRKSVRFYLPSLLWLLLLFLLHVQIWWAAFAWRDIPDWNFLGFLTFLLLPTAAYLMAALMLPDFVSERILDMRARYFEQRAWLFALLGSLPVVSLIQEWLLYGQIHWALDAWYRLSFIVIAIVGGVSSSNRVHQIIAPFTLLYFSSYVFVIFAKLTR